MPGPTRSGTPDRARGSPGGPRPEPRGASPACPLTLRGFLFLLLASGLFCAGAVRAELGALLCGTGLLAALLLSLVGVILEGRRQGRSLADDPEALEVQVGKPREDGRGFLRCPVSVRNRSVPLPRAPGIASTAAIRLAAGNGRTAASEIRLPVAGSEEGAALPGAGALPRGVYRGAAEIRARDVFGFFRVRRAAVSGLEAVVPPSSGAASFVSPLGEGGESPVFSDRLVRGEERFDSRPYAPGDDPRRIHWKQYARFGSLFVRPGDLTPPPRRALRVFVDTERPSYVQGEEGEIFLDTVVAAAAFFAGFLTARGRSVACSAWGIPDAPEDEEGLRRWFAGLVWKDGPPATRDTGPEPLVVFGAPGSPARRTLLSARAERGLRSVLVFPGLTPQRPRTWRDLLFREGTDAVKFEPRKAFRRNYTKARELDERDLAGRGGVDVHVL